MSITTTKAIGISAVVLIAVCIIIILFIGIVSIRQLSSLKKLQAIFKYIFHISWTISCIGLILFITTIPFCNFTGKTTTACHFLQESGFIFIYSLYLIILLTLLLRLHFAFNETIYALSRTTKFILAALYICATIIFLVFSGYYISDVLMPSVSFHIRMVPILNLVTTPLYIVTTIITIIIFSKKLMLLIETRNRTASINIDIDDNDTNNLPGLDKYQISMIENTTRYVSLLTLSIFSSCCVMAVSIKLDFEFFYNAFNDGITIIYMITSIDCVINIICLYLQYSFSKRYYEKYCNYLHLCWRCLLTRKATKSLMKRYRKATHDAKVKQMNENMELMNTYSSDK